MPKKKEKQPYVHPVVAFTQLINFALESILCSKHGTRVRWTLKVQFSYGKDYKPAKGQLATRMGGTVHSGDGSPEMENYLTGSEHPVPEPDAKEVEDEDAQHQA